MRIVHAVFTRSLFGSERYAADLANRQAAAGHEAHLLIAPGSPLAGEVRPEVTVHRVGALTRAFALRGVIDAIAPDILHAHLSVACRVFSRMRHRPPAVATLHVGYKPHRHRRLDGLIALSDAAAARIHGYPGKVERIWNWAPERAPAEPGAGEALRAELGLSSDAFVVGFCGRLHPSKNPQLLVRAFRAAAPANAALLLAGDGPERASVAALAEGDTRIRLLGYRTDVARLYQAFDLFVLPSRVEQAPLVLFEAMTAGVPLAATAIEGPEEILKPTPARLFASGDEAALAAIIAAEAAHGRRRQTYDLSPFDPARQVQKILAFYDEIRSKRASPAALS